MSRSVIAKHLSKALDRYIRFFRFSPRRSPVRANVLPTSPQTGLAQAVRHTVPSESGLGHTSELHSHEGEER